MYTYQDFVADGAGAEAVEKAITKHRTDIDTLIALDADTYDRQQNSTIMRFVRMIYTASGLKVPDFTASNNRLCSNFFHRINVQRNTYSLGNGVTFDKDGVKEKLGKNFDNILKKAGYFALIHKVSFLFWNVDRVHYFKFTEFAPLFDEETGALRAGVRYWQIDSSKPVMAICYEEDGYTKYKGNSKGTELAAITEKSAYKVTYKQSEADSEPETIAEENYSALPIVPLYGSSLRQSTLIGNKGKIDAYDLVSSGFANDLQDCQEIYWIVSNAGGMSDRDLAKFRDRLKLTKVANIPNADDVSISAQTNEIPTAARKTFKDDMRSEIYDGFGAFDVKGVSASNQTATAINAAYQPLDEEADDYEYELIEAVQALLLLQGIEATPIFKRNRISNVKEQTETIMLAAEYLDDETILEKLPFLTPEEVEDVLEKKAEIDTKRLLDMDTEEEDENEEE